MGQGGSLNSWLSRGDNGCPREEVCQGLENLGNTCYCNSVIQALYHCEPFREHCLKYKNEAGDNMLGALAEVFAQISTPKNSRNAVKRFIQKVRKENVMFQSSEHHDAHEFFNFLVNDIAESLIKKASYEKRKYLTTFKPSSPSPSVRPRTWIHQLFEGTLACETRCRRCDNVTEREEPFLDLSVEVEHNSTLKGCIESFGATEVLRHGEKYFCDSCGSLQEAERKLRIGCLPPLLAVHLKRFKFDDASGQYYRLTCNVPFPIDLTLTSRAARTKTVAKVHYNLLAVIVHIGQTMQHGHYVCCSYHNNRWRIFDDQRVEVIGPEVLTSFYEGMKCGYLLLYKENSASGTENAEVSSSSRRLSQSSSVSPKNVLRATPSSNPTQLQPFPALAD